jgi:hypothetical protein
MSRKVFTAGEVLAASDVNDFLMDQTIMTFAGTAARGSAIGTATEGMYAHLNDTDTLTYYNGSAWVNRVPSAAILQVVSTTKTDTFSTTSSTFTSVTGLSATITPSSTSSKIYVSATITGNGAPGASILFLRLTRAGTAIFIGDTAGSRTRAGAASLNPGTDAMQAFVVSGLDSPSSTSALTYGVEIRGNGNAVVINRTSLDSDLAGIARTVSTITLMEVAA